MYEFPEVYPLSVSSGSCPCTEQNKTCVGKCENKLSVDLNKNGVSEELKAENKEKHFGMSFERIGNLERNFVNHLKQEILEEYWREALSI